jgi:hypothetical protein
LAVVGETNFPVKLVALAQFGHIKNEELVIWEKIFDLAPQRNVSCRYLSGDFHLDD